MTVGEMKRMLMESPNEFRPIVFGNDESKKINDKAYSDIKKETEKYDGGLTRKKNPKSKSIGVNDNKGMADLNYDNINEPFKQRVGAQARGYASKDAEAKHSNDDFGNADFSSNKQISKTMAAHANAVKQGKDKASQIGLTGRELEKKKIEDLDNTMYEGKKKIKMLSFKNTEFISEGHVLSKVPDEYKTEGNRFIMKDSAKNEYLVEWNNKEPKVTKKLNMALVNEQKNRIKALWEYKSAEAYTSTPNFRLHEETAYSDMVKRARELMKD